MGTQRKIQPRRKPSLSPSQLLRCFRGRMEGARHHKHTHTHPRHPSYIENIPWQQERRGSSGVIPCPKHSRAGLVVAAHAFTGCPPVWGDRTDISVTAQLCWPQVRSQRDNSPLHSSSPSTLPPSLDQTHLSSQLTTASCSFPAGSTGSTGSTGTSTPQSGGGVSQGRRFLLSEHSHYCSPHRVPFTLPAAPSTQLVGLAKINILPSAPAPQPGR